MLAVAEATLQGELWYREATLLSCSDTQQGQCVASRQKQRLNKDQRLHCFSI